MLSATKCTKEIPWVLKLFDRKRRHVHVKRLNERLHL